MRAPVLFNVLFLCVAAPTYWLQYRDATGLPRGLRDLRQDLPGKMNLVAAIFFWAVAILGGMYLKNYVGRFAGRNLFVLIAGVLIAEIALLTISVFFWALTK